MIHVFNAHGYEVDLLGLTPERPLPVRKTIVLGEDPRARSRRTKWMAQARRALATLSVLPNSLERYLARRWKPQDDRAWQHSLSYDVVVIENVDLFPVIQAAQCCNRSYWISELRDFDWKTQGLNPQERLRILGDRTLFRAFLPRSSEVITVSQDQEQELFQRLALGSRVIRSLPNHRNIAPSPVQEHRIALVYHGAIARGRSSHLMIQAMKHLDMRFTLDLFVPSSVAAPRYLRTLQKAAEFDERIRFHEGLNYSELLEVTSRFDLGLALFPPTTTSLKGALPNKFFEYIQARLGVVVGPNSEMSDYVRRYKFGVVTDGFGAKDVAAALNALTVDDISEFKHRADAASPELCFENEEVEYKSMMEAIRVQRK